MRSRILAFTIPFFVATFSLFALLATISGTVASYDATTTKKGVVTLQGIFYTTGKTIKYVDLSANTARVIYTTKANSIDGLYYDQSKNQLWFQEKTYTKKNEYEVHTALNLQRLDLKSSTTTSILKDNSSSLSNPDYMPKPVYLYNNYLLFQVDSFESSYLKLYDLKTQKTVLTVGENSFCAAFPKGGEVLVISCDDQDNVKGYFKFKLDGSAKLEKINVSTYQAQVKNAPTYFDYNKLNVLPGVSALPVDSWGNFSTHVTKSGNYLVMLTYASGRTVESTQGSKSYFADMVTIYDLSLNRIVQNILLKDITTEYAGQPFAVKN